MTSEERLRAGTGLRLESAGPARLHPAAVPAGRLLPSQNRRAARPDDDVVTTGHRIARRFFGLCESPRSRDRLLRLVRTSADSAVGGRLLVGVLSRTVLTPLLRSQRVDAATVTVELIAAQLGGIAVLRYVTRLEPLASLPVDDLVALVGPAVQATLDRPKSTVTS